MALESCSLMLTSFTLDAATGAEITKKLTLPGASSALSIGAIPPTALDTGTGIWIDRTGLYGLDTNVLQVKIDAATGELTAGAGKVVLDITGIQVTGGTTGYTAKESYKVMLADGSTLGAIFGLADYAGYIDVKLQARSLAAHHTYLTLGAEGVAGKDGWVALIAAETDGDTLTLLARSDGGGYVSIDTLGGAADLRVGGGLYVGSIDVDPPAGTILATGVIAGFGNGIMLFNAADGLLLLDSHGEINATEWWSQRLQMATLSGAYNLEQGRWAGTDAVRVDPAATNLVVNPSFEVNITDGWAETDADASMTPTRSVTYAREGVASLKLVNADAGDDDYMETNVGAGDAETDYTITAWVKCTAFTAGATGDRGLLAYDADDAGGTIQADTITAVTNGWVKQQVTITTTATPGAIIVRLYGPQGTVYWDAVNCTEGDYSTSHIDGSLGTGYAWDGAAHNSTSTRTVTQVNLDAHIGLISENATVSYAMWVQMPYDSDATWPSNFSEVFYADTDGDNLHRLTYHSPSETWYFVVREGAVGRDIYAVTPAFSAGDWLYFVCTADFTGDGILYINGEVKKTLAISALSPPVMDEWNLGTTTAVGNSAGYAISEYAVFDRVLTAAEIGGLYSQHRPLVDAGAFIVSTQ